MTVIAIVIAVAVIVFMYSIKRGRLAVRAHMYIVARGLGASEEEANKTALRIDSFGAAKIRPSTMIFCRNSFGGSQLSMISSARMDGFLE